MLVIKKYYNDASIIILPADHLINNDQKFIEIIRNGYEFLESVPNSIVTFCINPNRPERGYGYIKVSNNERKEANSIIKVRLL
ncbi:sugar phosphate nucleotidyltransferase [Clostridium saccharoperbutylacetonicum]|uniref:sugar phosphate nucleotidyltransferase n=1 Tax=Clostridium saccharoperbutylacetonicum TaxID=36745 RepID=UPI0039EA4B1C